MHNNNINEKKK